MNLPSSSFLNDQAKQRSWDLLRALLDGRAGKPFAVRFWDGQEIPSHPDAKPAFTFILTHPGALRRMLLPPGELSLAEAYLRGDFDIQGDIFAALDLGAALEGYRLRDWLSLARQVLALPSTQPPRPHLVGRKPARLRGRPHSLERDQQAIRYHYDVGNDFYALFLGKWMTYSCAYFEEPDWDLDRAQEAKLDLICRKLRLKPGERLLDVGCGWGGLVIYAAKHYGVQATGITLSPPQVEYARRWAEREGVADRVEILQRDYRQLDPNQPFDKIASVGMFEHVGRPQMGAYFENLLRVLRPGGLLLNHAIAALHRREPSRLERILLQKGQFVQRYVFPDGELVPISEALHHAEHGGFEVRDVESLREHYALTLRHWVRNLERNHEHAVTLKDERTYRTWRLYMAASAKGFERGSISVFQSLLVRADQGKSGLPLTRQHLYQQVPHRKHHLHRSTPIPSVREPI
jgi:cyclopropane-fatty-acyl-phospholipid synthase